MQSFLHQRPILWGCLPDQFYSWFFKITLLVSNTGKKSNEKDQMLQTFSTITQLKLFSHSSIQIFIDFTCLNVWVFCGCLSDLNKYTLNPFHRRSHEVKKHFDDYKSGESYLLFSERKMWIYKGGVDMVRNEGKKVYEHMLIFNIEKTREKVQRTKLYLFLMKIQ